MRGFWKPLGRVSIARSFFDLPHALSRQLLAVGGGGISGYLGEGLVAAQGNQFMRGAIGLGGDGVECLAESVSMKVSQEPALLAPLHKHGAEPSRRPGLAELIEQEFRSSNRRTPPVSAWMRSYTVPRRG